MIWWIIFLCCSGPMVYLLAGALGNTLGPDPAKLLAHSTGEWALRLLLLTLCMSPMRFLTGRGVWIRYRRMLGLFAFFYAALHLLVYWWFILGAEWTSIVEEVTERPFITAGAVALLLLLPMAATSTNASRKKMGKYWLWLHRSIYPAVVLVLLHMVWQARSDLGESIFYALLFVILMALRLPVVRSKLQLRTAR